MREKLGGKGANLAEMALLGLPVPPGFTSRRKFALPSTPTMVNILSGLRLK